MTSPTPPSAPPPLNPFVKLLIEVGPLTAFFVTNAQKGLFTATAVFMVTVVIALAANWVLARRMPTLPLVTAAFVLVFGGLTLYLNDSLFIKLKPTVVNVLFATTLAGGMMFGKSFLKSVVGEALSLTDEGWRVLTYRWAFYFAMLAIANEIVWRNFSDDIWVSFKVFGVMPATILFSVAQLPLMNRYKPAEESV